MASEGSVETEIKLAIAEPESIVIRIREAGFTVHKDRVFEVNHVYDTPAGALRGSSQLLRLREAGGIGTLTWKGPSQVAGPHKSRPEIETTVDKPQSLDAILQRLGFTPQFRYDKYRTEFRKPGEDGTITLDETPVGWFVELEGEASWIDATAALLGFDRSQYITASYGALYFEYCRRNGQQPHWMIFPS